VTGVIDADVATRVDVLVHLDVGSARTDEPGHDHEVADVEERIGRETVRTAECSFDHFQR